MLNGERNDMLGDKLGGMLRGELSGELSGEVGGVRFLKVCSHVCGELRRAQSKRRGADSPSCPDNELQGALRKAHTSILPD